MINYKWIRDNITTGEWTYREATEYLEKRLEEEIYTEICNYYKERGTEIIHDIDKETR